MGLHISLFKTTGELHSEPQFSCQLGSVTCSRIKSFDRDAEIFGQPEPANCLSQLSVAQVRTCHVLRDHRRHIAESISLETLRLKPTQARVVRRGHLQLEILIIKHSVLAVLAEHDKDIARRLRDMMSGELDALRPMWHC